jgi:hypothetical protein
MIVTVLAILCLALLGFLTVVGYRAIIRGGESASRAEGMEKCTVCRRSVRKERMVERQIGDYRLLFFCAGCVRELASDLRLLGDTDAAGGQASTGGPSDSSA